MVDSAGSAVENESDPKAIGARTNMSKFLGAAAVQTHGGFGVAQE